AASRKLTLGTNTGTSGTLNVRGGTLTAAGSVYIGFKGTGALNVSGGGTVSTTGTFSVADSPNSNGTVTVSGSGSKVSTSQLYVGSDDVTNGQMTIQNGASLTASNPYIGNFSATANGTLTITSGSSASLGSVTIGQTLGSGAVNIDGGSIVTTNSMFIGNSGPGTLTVSGGAKLTSTQNNSLIAPVFIGGTATVTGVGSQWTIVGNSSGDPVFSSQAVLVLGSKANATGSLIVADGGKAEIAATASGTNGNFRQIRLGVSSGSTGALTVTGVNSSFTTPYDIWAGYNAGTTGKITVSNGGTLNTGYTIVGSAGTGSAEVTGTGSVWTLIDSPNVPADYPHGLQIGQSSTSTGVLTIANGGTVNVNSTGGSVVLGGAVGSQGTLNIGAAAASPAAAAGTLNATNVIFATGATGTINFYHTSNNYVFATAIQGTGPGTVNFLSGTTILTGNNTYAGTTTISAGATAQFGNRGTNGGSNGLISGSVTNNGAMIVNLASLFTTYGGVISGSGTFEQAGTGTLALTGTNTYTGQTTISSGTLQVGNGGTTGTISNNVLNNSVLIFNRSNSFSYNGVISGTGSVTKDGAGTMTLNGVNTYTGGTAVQTGTLRLGGNDRLATTGRLFLFSAGTFDLGGFNQTVGDLSGPGTVAIGSSTFTAGTANDRTFAGRFTGNGAFGKQGSGLLNLTGNSPTYTGTTTVAAGTLAVNGDLSGSAVTVNTGAILGGNGTVGATTINGVVAPGNSIGTLNIAGNYTQATGSTYRVEINNTSAADLLNITGTATIQSGTTVNVLPAPGLYTVGYRYTILTAAGGRTGTYDNLVYNAPFLDLSLAYDPNNVFLDVTRSSVAFSQVAQTPNQIAAAGGAESLGPGNPVYNSIVGLASGDAQRAFDQLSGEIHASVQNAIVESSRFPRDAILGRLRQDVTGGGATQINAVTLGDIESAMAYAGKRHHPLAQMPRNPVAPVLAAWAQAYGDTGRTGGDGNAASTTRRTGGFITGIDLSHESMTSWRIGLAAGYQQTGLSVPDRASSATIDAYNLALYGSLQHGPLGLRAGAAYGWNNVTALRSIAFPGFTDSTRATYSSGVGQV
ncbi:MAG: autotransporter outer membrane beta-barrel domain-containing protein, partial [Pseudolabrys sp.]